MQQDQAGQFQDAFQQIKINEKQINYNSLKDYKGPPLLPSSFQYQNEKTPAGPPSNFNNQHSQNQNNQMAKNEYLFVDQMKPKPPIITDLMKRNNSALNSRNQQPNVIPNQYQEINQLNNIKQSTFEQNRSIQINQLNEFEQIKKVPVATVLPGQNFENQIFQQPQTQIIYQPRYQSIDNNQKNQTIQQNSNAAKKEDQQFQIGQQINIKKKDDYLNLWQNEIKQKEIQKRKEREEKIAREREELQKIIQQNPFGKKDDKLERIRQSQNIQNSQIVQQKPQVALQQETQNNQYDLYSLPQMNLNQPNQLIKENNMNHNIPPQQFNNIHMNQQIPQFIPPNYQQQQYQNYQQDYQPQYFQNNQYEYQNLQIGNPYNNFQAPPNVQNINAYQQPAIQQNQLQVPIMESPAVSQSPAQNKNILKPPLPPSAPKNENMINQLGAYQYDINDNASYKESQKQRLQLDLQQQIEEQKNRKQMELKKRKEEELKEEQRIIKEREELEKRFQEEMSQKKKKINDIQQANSVLIKQKESQIQSKKDEIQIFEPKRKNNVQKQEMEIVQNDKEQDRLSQQEQKAEQKEFKPSTSSLLHGQQQLISELKNNFEREMIDLKNQMFQQQNQFKQQMDNLVKEQLKAKERKEIAEREIEEIRKELEIKNQLEIKQRNDIQNRQVLNEMKQFQNSLKPDNYYKQPNISEEFDIKAEQDRKFPPLQSQLKQSAPRTIQSSKNDKLNPFDQIGIQQKNQRIDSRNSERKNQMGAYEQLFFNNSQKNQSIQQIEKEEKFYGVGRDKNSQIVDLRNIITQDEYFGQNSMNQNTGMMSSGKKSMVGRSDFIPLKNYEYTQNYDYDNFQLGDKSIQVLATQSDKQDAVKAFNMQKVNNVDLSSEQSDTMNFIEKMINQGQTNNRENEFSTNKSKNQQEASLTQILNNFKMPEYNGIQKGLYSDQKILATEQSVKFGKHTDGNANSSIGTINLDALLQKQDKRLERIEKQGADLNRLYTLDSTQPTFQQQNQSKSNNNDELKNLDTLLFDLLKN